jgi:hypothetical protein
MAVMSFGGILMIAIVVFAIYGMFHMLFAGQRPVEPAPTTTSLTPEWVTPVVLAGLTAFGFASRMPWWIVVFGSLFAVMMLVKFGVLAFGKPMQTTVPTPPPLPRDPRMQNATYHPTLPPPPRTSSGFGGAAMFATVLLVIGLAVVGVNVVRDDRVQAPRHLEVVVAESWKDAMRDGERAIEEAKADMKRGMAEMKQEFRVGKKEAADAAKVVAQVFRTPPTPPVAPPSAVVSPAIPPEARERVMKVLGQDQKKEQPKSGGKNKKPPKSPPPPAPPPVREPAVRIDHFRTPQELAELPTSESPNGVYFVLTDPKDQQDDFLAAFERAKILFKNHMKLHHSEVDENSLNMPTFAWFEANGLIQKRYERENNRLVLALGTNFSERATDLAYNYHLGIERTRDAAKGYFGGLLVLGGLGLLLRIGTGVRPTAPAAKA